MDFRNRTGLYGSYFFGVAAIGFTLPYLPLYLAENKGLSDRAIGLVSTLAALASLAQFPIGIWSDRVATRKPFLIAALALILISTILLPEVSGVIGVAILIVLFAENGLGRASVESLSGAEATSLARAGELGSALGMLRVWKPIGIIAVALLGRWLVPRYGTQAVLMPLMVCQALAVALALLIHENHAGEEKEPDASRASTRREWLPRDPALWVFVAAMVLFHCANAPGGVYLGLFLNRTLHAPDSRLADAFIVSMIAWMVVVWPAGWLADRWGRKPLLILCWSTMALRLALVAMAEQPWQVVANQTLDGLSNGLFAVLAAAWVTDRLGDPRRAGEAQVLVGCSLVLGSAIGPGISGFVVDAVGYRALFGGLAAVGAVASFLVAAFVPETLPKHRELHADGSVEPMAVLADLSTTL
ncbi:MAG TPA: MFS transporter [Isosphaeraceae bacterium]|nr:MFS transporter [Isosphaeraceae bacterium]